MTTLTANVSDVTGADDNSVWRFSSVLREGSDTNTIVTTHSVLVTPINGALTVELEPGVAIATYDAATVTFTVPDVASADLWPLLQAGIAVPPDTAADALAAAIEAYLDVHGAGAATAADLAKLHGAGMLSGNNTGDQDLSGYATTAAVAAGYQPWDADLTALAALTAPATKLGGIAAGATANDTDANLKNRANHTGTQTSSTISDLTESVQDIVGALLSGTTGVTVAYNDAANTLTISGLGDTSATAETIRDTIGVALIGTGLISVTANDALDTITVTTTATQNDTDANLKNRANHTGTQSADTLTDGTTNKAFLATERTKLTGIASGATANDTDANLKNRANHTGTQTASTISDFSAAADARVVAAIITGGSMGATPALNAAGRPRTQYTGTLTANATLTISNIPAGGEVVLELTQDATGGRTLNITGVVGSIPIDTAANAPSAILVFSPDGSTLWVTGQRGAAGADGADASSAGIWLPAHYGWKAWSYDISDGQSGNAPSGGSLTLVALQIPTPMTITNVILHVHTAGATLTSGQCFAGLYQGGSLLAATVDQSTNWLSTGTKVMALTAPQAVSAGVVYVAYFANGTARPAFLRSYAVNSNGALSAPNFRYAFADSGLTTALPSSYGTQTAATIAPWAAVS